MKTLFASLLLLVVVTAPTQTSDNKKDIVKKTATFTGKVTGFEIGDYVHVKIRNTKGADLSYFVGGGFGLDYFMAAHANKTGTFTVQFVSSYIPEAGGREDIERISNAQFGKVTFRTWMRDQRKKMTNKQISDKYEPLIQKLSAGPR